MIEMSDSELMGLVVEMKKRGYVLSPEALYQMARPAFRTSKSGYYTYVQVGQKTFLSRIEDTRYLGGQLRIASTSPPCSQDEAAEIIFQLTGKKVRPYARVRQSGARALWLSQGKSRSWRWRER